MLVKRVLKYKAYDEAHSKASPQSGSIYYRYLDKLGIELPPTGNPYHSYTKYREYYVRDQKGKIVTIWKQSVKQLIK